MEEAFDKYMTEEYGEDYDEGDDPLMYLLYERSKKGFEAGYKAGKELAE